jgi:hypothetical protein
MGTTHQGWDLGRRSAIAPPRKALFRSGRILPIVPAARPIGSNGERRRTGGDVKRSNNGAKENRDNLPERESLRRALYRGLRLLSGYIDGGIKKKESSAPSPNLHRNEGVLRPNLH